MKRLKVGFIGTGWWANEIAENLSDKFELVTCYSRNEENRKKFAEKWNMEDSNDLDTLFANSLDLAVLTLPNSIHMDYANKCIDNNLSFYLEKPAGTSGEELLEVINYSKEKNVPFFVGYNKKFHPVVEKSREYLDINEIKEVRTKFERAIYSDEGTKDWRWDFKNCPLGPFTQLGVHHVDTLLNIIGKKLKLENIDFGKGKDINGIPSEVNIRGKIDSINISILSNYDSDGYVNEMEFEMKNGDIVKINDEKLILNDNELMNIENSGISLEKSLDYVYEILLNSKKENMLSPENAYKVLKIHDKILEKWTSNSN